MKSSSTILSILGIVLAMGLLASTEADPKKVNLMSPDSAKKIQPDQTAEQVAQVSLAQSLVTLGRETGSPLYLITAASILRQVQLSSITKEPKIEPAGASGDKPGDHSPSMDAGKLLAEAKGSTKDPALIALADQVAKEEPGMTLRGAAGGPQYAVKLLPAYSTVRYVIPFRQGEWARIAITGDHDSDMDFWVYDENGNLVVSDTDNTDIALFEFIPLWTSDFTVVIKNLGSISNRFVLVTN